MRAHTHIYVCITKVTSSVFLNHFALYLLKQGLPVKPELADLEVYLQLALGTHCAMVTEATMFAWFLRGF